MDLGCTQLFRNEGPTNNGWIHLTHDNQENEALVLCESTFVALVAHSIPLILGVSWIIFSVSAFASLHLGTIGIIGKKNAFHEIMTSNPSRIPSHFSTAVPHLL